jgi:hypothetical protein
MVAVDLRFAGRPWVLITAKAGQLAVTQLHFFGTSSAPERSNGVTCIDPAMERLSIRSQYSYR